MKKIQIVVEREVLRDLTGEELEEVAGGSPPGTLPVAVRPRVVHVAPLRPAGHPGTGRACSSYTTPLFKPHGAARPRTASAKLWRH